VTYFIKIDRTQRKWAIEPNASGDKYNV